MKGHTSPLLFLAGALLANAAEPTTSAPAKTSPADTPAPATTATISPETSARVTAELPRFEPARVAENSTS